MEHPLPSDLVAALSLLGAGDTLRREAVKFQQRGPWDPDTSPTIFLHGLSPYLLGELCRLCLACGLIGRMAVCRAASEALRSALCASVGSSAEVDRRWPALRVIDSYLQGHAGGSLQALGEARRQASDLQEEPAGGWRWAGGVRLLAERIDDYFTSTQAFTPALLGDLYAAIELRTTQVAAIVQRANDAELAQAATAAERIDEAFREGALRPLAPELVPALRHIVSHPGARA